MFNTRKAAYLILIVICLGIALAVAGRLTGAPATKVFTEDGLAIRGYDPVAYFDQQKPVKGDPAFAAEWNEVTWHFASADNREKFMDDPEPSRHNMAVIVPGRLPPRASFTPPSPITGPSMKASST